MTYVIFLVSVSYDVAIALFLIGINCPVHQIKQKISHQSDSEQQPIAQMA